MLLAMAVSRSIGSPATVTTGGSLPVMASTSAACSASVSCRAESGRPTCARTTRVSWRAAMVAATMTACWSSLP